MTPELKIACEVVFQEHKTSVKPVTWSKDLFVGRLSFGLSAMAKEILVSKNIICFANPEKKMITRLNPAVVAAATFEEAGELVKNRTASFTTSVVDDQQDYIHDDINDSPKNNNYRLVRIAGETETVIAEPIWYTQPLFVYFIWPACAAIAGALITWLMGVVYTKLFF